MAIGFIVTGISILTFVAGVAPAAPGGPQRRVDKVLFLAGRKR
jgi:hypothetical protein